MANEQIIDEEFELLTKESIKAGIEVIRQTAEHDIIHRALLGFLVRIGNTWIWPRSSFKYDALSGSEWTFL